MKQIKRMLVMLLVVALMVPTATVFGEDTSKNPSAGLTKFDEKNVTVENPTVDPATGKVNVVVKVDGVALVEGTDYVISSTSEVKDGKQIVTFTIVGKGKYTGTVTKTATIDVTKAKKKNVIKAKKKIKAATLKKKAVKVKIKRKEKAKITVKITKKSKKKYKKFIKIGKKNKVKIKKGKLTIKKGAPKGKIVLKVTAKATKNYKKTTKKITIKVK